MFTYVISKVARFHLWGSSLNAYNYLCFHGLVVRDGRRVHATDDESTEHRLIYNSDSGNAIIQPKARWIVNAGVESRLRHCKGVTMRPIAIAKIVSIHTNELHWNLTRRLADEGVLPETLLLNAEPVNPQKNVNLYEIIAPELHQFLDLRSGTNLRTVRMPRCGKEVDLPTESCLLLERPFMYSGTTVILREDVHNEVLPFVNLDYFEVLRL